MIDRRELVFGFVAPLGVDRDLIEDCLRTALCAADYSLDKIHVSGRLEAFAEGLPASGLKRKEILMNAGDKVRQAWSTFVKKDRGDAVALAAISEIRSEREEANLAGLDISTGSEAEKIKTEVGNKPRESTAYLIDSLKHPHELQLLKRIYGPAFISIGVYVPPDMRLAFLLKQEGASGDDLKAVQLATSLMLRDETGEDESGMKLKLGQDVSDAFFISDFIVDGSKQKRDIVSQFTRLIELLFGDIYKTPSLDEVGMFLARGVQVRSGSLSRQIGAAILRKDGSVVAIGTNEAARPISGGQYWFEDDHEYRGRDMVYRTTDTSDQFRAEMLADLLDLLDKAKVLSDEFSTDKFREDAQRVQDLRKSRLEKLYYDKSGPLRKARLRDNIDYIRAVHAEGAAIIDAARHGVATKRCTLFSTTFPCHECARHIVAAGIREVVYLEPYPKSAVKDLFEDSIEVDPYQRNKKKVLFRTFVGVSPSRYLEFFTVDRDRKDIRGQRVPFDPRKEAPHLPEFTPPASVAEANERLELQKFTEFLGQAIAVPSTHP
jgi:deoxycytidylate deaminase